MQEYEQAANSFEKALEANPNLPQISFFCGVAYFFTGRYQEALDKLETARQNNLAHEDLDLWIAYCKMALYRFAEAEGDFARAISVNAENYLAFDGLGVCLSKTGRHQEALASFRQALMLNADYGLGYWHLARCLEALDKPDEALQQYHLAYAKDKACLAAEKQLLEQMIKQAPPHLVLKKCLRLVEILPQDVELQLILVKFLRKQNRLDEAKYVLSKLLESNPQSAEGNCLLGHIYLAQGMPGLMKNFAWPAILEIPM